MREGWCRATPGGVRLALQISANAKKTEVMGVLGEALKLTLAAAPLEGKANVALIAFLAKTLGVPRSALRLTHGHTNKNKLIEISAAHLTPAAVAAVLLPSTHRGQTSEV